MENWFGNKTLAICERGADGEKRSRLCFTMAKLIVNWDQEDQSQIFVLNAKDGNVIWKTDRDEPTTWATPLVTQSKGSDIQQLITNGTTAVRSYNLDNGEIVWQAPGTTLNAIPLPCT